MRKWIPVLLALACALATGCQTTHPATKSQPTAQGQQPAAQGQQSVAQTSQPTGQAPSASPTQPLAPQVSSSMRAVARSVAAGAPGKFVRAVTADVNALIRKVQSLVKKPGPNRTGGTGENLTSRLRGVHMPPADVIVAVLSAVILLGGGTLTLAAIRAGRRRS